MSEVTQTAATSCILVCAGNASRMGGINKILMPLGESNVVGYSMLAFEQTPDITEIIVVTKPEYFDAIRAEAEKLGITKLKHLTEGGETRQKYGTTYAPCISDVDYVKRYIEEYDHRFLSIAIHYK